MTFEELRQEILHKTKYFQIILAECTAEPALERTKRDPGPPVDTGYLRSSAHAEVRHHQPGEVSRVKITYSAPKHAGENANVFYEMGGTRWFNYAEYQHIHHAHNALWVYNALSGADLDEILAQAKICALSKI